VRYTLEREQNRTAAMSVELRPAADNNTMWSHRLSDAAPPASGLAPPPASRSRYSWAERVLHDTRVSGHSRCIMGEPCYTNAMWFDRVVVVVNDTTNPLYPPDRLCSSGRLRRVRQRSGRGARRILGELGLLISNRVRHTIPPWWCPELAGRNGIRVPPEHE
jgi:hypothetical protein